MVAEGKFHLECQIRWCMKERWRRNGVFSGAQSDYEFDCVEFDLELELELKVKFEKSAVLNFRSNLSYFIAGRRGTSLF